MKSTGSETSANFYHSIRRQIPEDRNLQSRRLENIGSHTIDVYELPKDGSDVTELKALYSDEERFMY